MVAFGIVSPVPYKGILQTRISPFSTDKQTHLLKRMNTILVFLKAPITGSVKTRLANSIGDSEALNIYSQLVERQLAALPEKYRIEIHFTPPKHEGLVREWLGDACDYYPQSDGDLSDRLKFASAESFKRGSESVFCIGGDCPNLGPAQFATALAQLAGAKDIVFGPTEDGGYYLVGMRAPHLEVFEDIPWSSRDTLTVSVEKATSLGLNVHFLETLYDVDTIDELERAKAEGLI